MQVVMVEVNVDFFFKKKRERYNMIILRSEAASKLKIQTSFHLTFFDNLLCIGSHQACQQGLNLKFTKEWSGMKWKWSWMTFLYVPVFSTQKLKCVTHFNSYSCCKKILVFQALTKVDQRQKSLRLYVTVV